MFAGTAIRIRGCADLFLFFFCFCFLFCVFCFFFFLACGLICCGGDGVNGLARKYGITRVAEYMVS